MLVFMKIAKNTEGSTGQALSRRGMLPRKARRALRGGLQRKNKKGCALFITHLVPANKFAASGE